ncbi:glutathione S-transferase [Schizophyllum amplum]|uniref:Glutathione S-transferase n=1 Tax=Schizophyllum amplum TaxID=97359 RepID=A0A550C425_9AGAR|nr:glutathione S-transferase [Auriculariopsis ampla]
MTAQITLYAGKTCPYAHRAEIALAETGLPFKRVEIDPRNKPEWYPNVNPRGQVPAITYGGPDHPPEKPSPEAEKLAESLVLVDFFNDLAPTILSSPPIPSAAPKPATSSRPLAAATPRRDKLLDGIESLQALLPATSKYAIGDEYTIADIAATPFFARLEVALRDDLGAFAQGEGLKPRDSFKKTWHEEFVKASYAVRFPRNQ